MNFFEQKEIPDLIKIGEVSSIDPAKGTARVVFDDEDSIVSYDLQILQRNTLKTKDFHSVNVGEDVVCLFMGAGQEDGFIIGSVYAGEIMPPESSEKKRTTLFEDGTKVSYDMSAHELTVIIEGTKIVANRQTISITAPQAVTVNCATATVNASSSVKLDTPKTDITGVLNVTGLITGQGGLAVRGGSSGASIQCEGNMDLKGTIDATGDIKAGAISLQNHQHPGDSGGTTGKPQ